MIGIGQEVNTAAWHSEIAASNMVKRNSPTVVRQEVSDTILTHPEAVTSVNQP